MLTRPLTPGEIINNESLVEIFQCSTQGGMRRSKATNTLVLVSNHVKSLYLDRWDDSGLFHYTGMGMNGDQSLDFMQNATLANSDTNGVELHLFEVFKPQQYTYRGQVQLAGSPYTETQPGEDGEQRAVWMFPLLLTEGSTITPIPEPDLEDLKNRREKAVRRLSDEELGRRAKSARDKPGRQQVLSTMYTRNESVAELARRRANGVCQLCNTPAPFRDKSGTPFLEVHHIQWLAHGGDDTLANTVALCPNCHRRMHVLDEPSDRKKLLAGFRATEEPG